MAKKFERLPHLSDSPDLGLLTRCSTFIVLITLGYLGLGAVTFLVWRISGDDSWVETFFQVPGALLIVVLSGTELFVSVQVWREFSAGQPLRNAWQLIAMSAACDFGGAIAAQILSGKPVMRLAARMGWWSTSAGDAIRESGLLLGGSCRLLLLTAGFVWALKAFRKAGFLSQLTRTDWAVLALASAYVIREASDLIIALRHGKQPGVAEMLGWPVDPLLCVALAQAMLLFRSAQKMGQGLIGKCWKAFAAGVVFIILGDISIWATNYGFLPWPWSAIGWYIWLPAAAAFALAPLYQMEAICCAYASGEAAASAS